MIPMRTILPAGIDRKGIEQWILKHREILWLKEHCLFLDQWLNSENILCHTSGSTGSPKEIELSKAWLILSAQRSLNVFKLPQNAQLLLQLPADKIGGRMMIVRALIGGFDLHILPASSSIDDSRSYDFAAFTPHQLMKSLEQDGQPEIAQIILGGSQVPASLESTLQSWETLVYETYGMTETASHIALRPLNGIAPSKFFQCLEGIQIRSGEQDELWIRFIEGSSEIQTKDVVKIHSESEFEVLGRLDSAINSGGIKLFPETIERELSMHINESFFFFGERDELLGEHLALVIEGEEHELPDFKEILGKYQLPKRVYWVQSLVRTSNGKVNRSASIGLLNAT